MFSRYLTNQKISYFFMETPHPSLASVKMTDPLASYASNCNLVLKFYNSLRKVLNRKWMKINV